jgi:Protein of unknown function (DUF3306)
MLKHLSICAALASDPAALPSFDAIGAQTDFRAFLQPGVPSELKLAALRRAWSADPAIRDFKGMAENDWDFTALNSIPGFGEPVPGADATKMVAQLLGEARRVEPPVTTPPFLDGGLTLRAVRLFSSFFLMKS